MLINDNHENHEDHNNHKDQNNNNHDNIILMYIYILVGGFNPSEKYEFVSWDDFPFPIYGKSSKIPWFQTFQTTNQYIYIYYYIYYIIYMGKL